MSNQSRARTRAIPPTPEQVAEKAEREEIQAKAEAAFATPGRKGLEALVGLVMEGRNKPAPVPPRDTTPAKDHPVLDRAHREPSPYEIAIAQGLSLKPVYQDTVEGDRKIARRLRNKRARKARRINRLAAAHAVAWLLVAATVVGGVTTGKANASTFGPSWMVRTTVTWSGGNPCDRVAMGPTDANAHIVGPLAPATCSSTTTNVRTVRAGDYYGADPIIGDADYLACSVVNVADGALWVSDAGFKGDGHDITCLGRA